MSRRDSSHHKPPRSNRRPGRNPQPAGPRSRPAPPSLREAGAKQSDHKKHDRRGSTRHAQPESSLGNLERVQKILAHAGIGSRRNCEELIKQGRVSVDGQVVRELGTRVDPHQAKIAVDGEAIRLESMVYYAVNKPRGYVSTNTDPAGRPRVVDLLPEIPQRLYTVGRLDEESTGLMILTNDGELANRLAHPRFGVEKLYRALIAGSPEPETLAKITAGVWLSDGKVRAKRARLAGRQGNATILELVLAEGKNREIRRMLAKLGHKVMSLNRVAVGPVSVKGLSVGESRPLSRHEVDLLWKVANGAAVSLPRFLDRESSPRARRDSGPKPQAGDHRHGERTGPPRARRDSSPRPQTGDHRHGERTGPPRARRHDSGPAPRSASSSKRIRPPMPSHSAQLRSTPPAPLKLTPRQTSQPHEPPARKPPRHEQSGPPRTSKGPPMPRRAAPHSNRLDTNAPTRRIIGLEPESHGAPGSQFRHEREPSRKRPSPRSRRPSPAPPLKKRTLPFRPPGTAGEDE